MSTPRALFASLFMIAGLAAALSACTHGCPLGLHATYLIGPRNSAERVPCCGGGSFQDLNLLPSTEGQVQMTNVAADQQMDVFLVPTSCAKLFDGTYPGASPLCQIYIGPVTAKNRSDRVKLDAGTYRVWLQGYGTNTDTSGYQVMIDVLDYRCLPVVP